MEVRAQQTPQSTEPRQGDSFLAGIVKLEGEEAKQNSRKAREGDPEVTEPDSDADSLFGAAEVLPEGFKPTEAGFTRDSPACLTSEEVSERRLGHLHELYKLYKVEYWGLLEELRTRHHHFLEKQPKDGASTPEGNLQNNGNAGSGAANSIRKGLKHRRMDAEGNQPKANTKPRLLNADAFGASGAQPPLESGSAAEFTNPFEAYTTPGDQHMQDEDVRGSGTEDEPESFSDAEGFIVGQQGREGAVSKEAIQQWRAQYRQRLAHIERLEQSASACSSREMDREGALACLCGRQSRFLIKSNAVSLGRATDASQVDIDLASEGDARKVSRHQAHLTLQPDERFWLQNVGRRSLIVNNRQVDQGQFAAVHHLSLIEVGGVRLLFMTNHAAVKRAAARTAQLRA